jgi:uncharacterized membrane protein YbhN (UPF0104 family)
VLSAVLAVALLVLVVPRLASYGAAARSLEGLAPAALAGLGLLALANIATSALPWCAALPGLRFGRALVVTQSSTALSTVAPMGDAVGIAVTARMLRAARFDGGAIALAIMLTALWGQAATAVSPFAGLAALALAGRPTATLGLAGTLSLAALLATALAAVLVVVSERSASVLGRLGERVWPGAHDRLHALRSGTTSLVRRRWHVLTLTTLLSQAAAFAVFLVAVRALPGGGSVSTLAAFTAWAIARLIAAVPVTPAGVGTFEVTFVGTLHALGAPPATALASVLAYRALTVAPSLVLGSVLLVSSWVSGRRSSAPGRGGATHGDRMLPVTTNDTSPDRPRSETFPNRRSGTT